MMSRTRLVALALVVCLALAACGSDESPDPTATPPVASPTAVATPPPVTIGEVVWTSAVDGATGAPVDELSSLPNDAPQVIAAVNAGTLPAGTVLDASWTIDGDPLPALDPPPITVDEGRENAWIAWTLSWDSDQPWPIGVLGITVDVDGETQRASEIHIVRARE